MLAGTLELELRANMARLSTDLANAEKAVGGAMAKIERAADMATKALGLIGVGLSAAGLVAFVQKAIDAADALDDLAQSTGVVTERLSQMQYAARVGGGSVEGLNTIIQKLNRSIADGLAGDKEKLFLFKQLGVTMDDLKSKKADEVLLTIADAYSKARDGAGKVAVSQELMGKTAAEMIPFLNNGGEAIRNLMKEAEKLGLTISGDFAQQAGEFNDNMEKIKASSEKLSILIAGDLIGSLGKAAKAFAEATIEGGKFKGMIAGIQTFLTGDDQHKNNVKLVELTSELLDEENKLLKLRSGRATKEHLEMQAAVVKRVKEQIATTQGYRKELTATADAEKAAAEAGKAARANGTELKTSPKAVAQQASAYEALAKMLAEKVAAERQEMQVGRELNEFEKLRLKVTSDITASKKALTVTELAHVNSLLQEAKTLMEGNALREKRLKQMQAEAAFLAEIDEESAAAATADSKAREQVAQSIDQQVAALRESGEALKVEAALLGATDRQRSVTIEHLRIEQQLRRDLDALSRNLAFDEAQRDIERERLRTNAKLAKDQAEQRGALEEQVNVWRSIDQTAHDVFVNIWEGGSNVFKKLGQTLKASVLDLLYQMTVRKWIIGIGASIGGVGTAAAQTAGSAGSGLLGSLGTSALGSSIMGGVSGFGSGVMSGLSAWGSGGSVTGLLGSVNMAGGAMNALGTIAGALGPIILGVAAIAALAKNFKGETRSGADLQYFHGVGSRESFTQSGGNPMGAEAARMVGATALAIGGLFASMGVQAAVAEMHGGFAGSDKGRGGVYAGGNLALGGRLLQFGEVGGLGTNSYESTSARSLSAEDAAKNFGTDLMQVQIQALQAAAGEIPETIRKMVEGIDAEALSDTDAQALVQRITGVADAVKGLGAAADLMPFANLRGLSFDAAAGLIELAGGLDTLLQRQESYYGNFYTEQERAAQSLANMTAALGEVGLAVPASRDAFRSLVEAQDLSTESGRETWNTLMGVQQAFADLNPILEDVAQATDDLADRHRDFLDKMGRYHEQFFTDEERRMQTALAIQRQLAAAGKTLDLGYILNADRQDFRDVFEAAFAAGDQALIDMLLDVADAFASMTPEVDLAAEALRTAESALSTYTSQLDSQASMLDGIVRTGEGYLESLRAVRRELTMGRLAGLTGEGQYHAARNEFLRLNTLPVASEERLQGLPDAVRAFMEASGLHLGGSSAQHFINRDLALGSIGASEGGAQTIVDVANTQLDVMRDLLVVLRNLDTNDAAAIQAAISNAQHIVNNTHTANAANISALWGATGWGVSTQQQMAAWNDAMGWATTGTQVGAINTSAVTIGRAVSGSVSAALAAMQQSSGPTPAFDVNGFGIGGHNPGTILNAVTADPAYISHPVWGVFNARQFLQTYHQQGNAAGAANWLKGLGLTEVDAAHILGINAGYVRNWFASVGIPQFAVGTNRVPHDMLAMVHRDEAIVPARYNPAAGGSDGTKEEIAALRSDVQRLTSVLARYASEDLENGRVVADEMRGASKAAQLARGDRRVRDLSPT